MSKVGGSCFETTLLGVSTLVSVNVETSDLWLLLLTDFACKGRSEVCPCDVEIFTS